MKPINIWQVTCAQAVYETAAGAHGIFPCKQFCHGRPVLRKHIEEHL